MSDLRQYESVGEIRKALYYEAERAADDLLDEIVAGRHMGPGAYVTLQVSEGLIDQIRRLADA